MPNTLLTEEELFYAIRSRYKIGAEQLYEKYACMLYKLISAQIEKQEIADLVLEETFAGIWADIHLFDINRHRLSIWVMSIARSRIKSALAKTVSLLPADTEYITMRLHHQNNSIFSALKKPA